MRRCVGNRRGWALVLVLLLGACGSHAAHSTIDASGLPDVGNVDLYWPPELGVGNCNTTADCPAGEDCFGHICATDPCTVDAGAAVSCPSGQACTATCLPTMDPCDGVTCGPDDAGTQQVCVLENGRAVCADACEQVPCEGVVCGAGMVCDPSQNPPMGQCAPVVPCSAPCPAGSVCTLSCATPDPCAHVKCPLGQTCAGGTCQDDKCARIRCPAGRACVDGNCVPINACPCTPTCPPPGQTTATDCGASDGCGGLCGSASEGCGPTQACNCVQADSSGFCIRRNCGCKPDCPTFGTCGGPDGCGGTCPGICPLGEVCGDGDTRCVCEPQCEGKSCGAPDGCGGMCGKGSCPFSELCLNDMCCLPHCPSSGPCGASDGCGGRCPGTCTSGMCDANNNCTCMPACPFNEICLGGACVCKPACSGKACGSSDGCGGTCSGACGCGQVCTTQATCGPLCGAGTTLCGCSACCTSSQECINGQCVIPPP
jgi:hypothetical protein